MSKLPQGQLFIRQIRLLRGIRTRIAKLSHSRSIDQQSLEFKKQQAIQSHSVERERMQTKQAMDLRSAMTNWDELLDRQMAVAERETLQSRNIEVQKTKQLKTKFIKDKADIKNQFETATEELRKNLEDAKSSLIKAKETKKAKLEQERVVLDQNAHECREWVGVRTGNALLQNLEVAPSASAIQDLSKLTELKQVAASFESAKNTMLRDMQRLKAHPMIRLVGSYLFLCIGVVLGGIAAWIAWLLASVPLIVGLVGVVGSLIFMAVIHFSTAPLVAKTIQKLFPGVVEQEQIAYRVLAIGHRIADSNCQSEIARREQAAATAKSKLETDYRANREKLLKDYGENLELLQKQALETRRTIAVTRVKQHSKIDTDRKPKIEQLSVHQSNESKQFQSDYEKRLQQLQDEFTKSQAFAVHRWADGCNRVVGRMQELQQTKDDRFPAWNSDCFTRGEWARNNDSLAWPLGEFNPNRLLNTSMDGLPTTRLSEEKSWPVFFDLLSHGALILETHPNSKPASNAILRNTLLRAITSMSAGGVNVTIIDPEGLGKQFSWLMSLADVDPSLVNHRVWTQPIHIAEQLSQTARHVEDIIQQSLRDKYKNLIEYNRFAGPMAVPYRLIVWANFPFGLDDHAWQSLCSILSSGGKCGVGVILQVSSTHIWPTFTDASKINEFGLRLSIAPKSEEDLEHATISFGDPELSEFELVPELPPDDDRLHSIMGHQVESVTNLGKRIVPFESIELPFQERQQVPSADGLVIPIGIADSGRVQTLKLGQGTAQHVLIAGKTGSGKSSLLHTLITSAAMKYAPDQLRLVLLDFKKGVEFQVYAESAISHADVIGIESKREFGVSTLEYIDRILNARGEAFRQMGVQDLGSLARKYPERAMPRILILIDEFQELFVEDDKVSQQASLLMDRIVRQGRSFGVHLILASQTLGGAYSLPRTTLSQMGVRIALQCDSSDAMLILSEDNTVAERLRHSGQAIYNDAGGRLESNQNFQVAYVEKNSQLEKLASLTKVPVIQSPTVNPLGRQIVFEGHKPAIWDESSIAMALSQLPKDPGIAPLILGDSVSIDPPVIKSLARNAGRNVMVVGQDESIATNLLASMIAGMMTGGGQFNPDQSGSPLPSTVLLLDGSRNEDANMSRLVSTLRDNAAARIRDRVRVVDVRGLDAAMEILQKELDVRLAAPNEIYPTLVFAVSNLARFRELRRADEYAYSDDSGGQLKPDAVIANVLRDGPALGIHVWIWADSAGTLNRWMSRQSLRDIELRVLMQMSASDSNQLIDSNTANRLDRYVVLVQDDVEGKAIKLRPFALEQTLEQLMR